ncbi:MAG TPA: phosphotransferase [Dehalococcoidales bacterium]
MSIDGILESYLKSEIYPQIASPPYGYIKSIRISQQKPVFVFRDSVTRAKIVGKYNKYGLLSPDQAWQKTEREFFNLTLLRSQVGMTGDHYSVVAPLGRNRVLAALLVTENAPGDTLDYYIARAIYNSETRELFYKLSDLARFFAKLHRNSDSGRQVSAKLPQWYLSTVLNSVRVSLTGYNIQETAKIQSYAGGWWNREGVFNDHEVAVHGDATPTNFVFHHGKVVGIDLEKMKWADRCWDLGFIAAELKHHFMWRAGDGWKAEPYIGHFLWEYGVAYGDTKIFYRITHKLPLYMALGLLRIARNAWLSDNYRYQLVGEAKLCLKSRP